MNTAINWQLDDDVWVNLETEQHLLKLKETEITIEWANKNLEIFAMDLNTKL